MAEPTDLELVRRLGELNAGARELAFATLFERHRRRAYELAHRVLGDPGLAADAVQEAFLTVYRKGVRFQGRSLFSSWLYRIVLNQAIDLRRRERRHRGTGRGTSSTGSPAGSGQGEAAGSTAPAGAERPAGGFPGGAAGVPVPSPSTSSSSSASAAGPSEVPRRAKGASRAAWGREAAELTELPDDAVEPPERGAIEGERAAAVRRAIEQLSPKLAGVVVLRYPRGLSYEEIGEILGLPPGTVKSRLNRAHAALRESLGDWLADD